MNEHSEQSVVETPAPPARAPLFHLESPPGSQVALCGFMYVDGGVPMPLHQGPEDCERCWEIARELGARICV